MLERALFNAAQGARFANGKALTYYSADERLWVRQRPPEAKAIIASFILPQSILRAVTTRELVSIPT